MVMDAPCWMKFFMGQIPLLDDTRIMEIGDGLLAALI